MDARTCSPYRSLTFGGLSGPAGAVLVTERAESAHTYDPVRCRYSSFCMLVVQFWLYKFGRSILAEPVYFQVFWILFSTVSFYILSLLSSVVLLRSPRSVRFQVMLLPKLEELTLGSIQDEAGVSLVSALDVRPRPRRGELCCRAGLGQLAKVLKPRINSVIGPRVACDARWAWLPCLGASVSFLPTDGVSTGGL